MRHPLYWPPLFGKDGLISAEAAQFFWAKVAISDDAEACWIWLRAKLSQKSPYGRFETRNKAYLAHRFAWCIANNASEVPKGMDVCHTCDNPACVNPNHLFLGSAADNMKDMVAKGRNKIPSHRPPVNIGSANSFSKLTEINVPHIRQLSVSGVPQREIARRFNVSQRTILNVLKRRTWGHIQ